MTYQRRLWTLVLVAFLTAITVAVISIFGLYRTALLEVKSHVEDFVGSQAQLISAVALPTSALSEEEGSENRRTALDRVRTAHRHFEKSGHIGALCLGQRQGDLIYCPVDESEAEDRFGIDSDFATPFLRALEGNTGSIRTRGRQNEDILAFYAPVEALDMALVASVELNEFRRPYLWVGVLLLGLITLITLSGSWAIFRVGQPFVKRLEARSRRFRTLFSVASAGLVLSKGDRIVEVNESLCEMLRLEPQDLIGTDGSFLWPDQQPGGVPSAEFFSKLTQQACQGSTPWVECVVRRGDGEPVHLDLRIKPLELGGESFLLSTIIDVTAKSEAERGLRLSRIAMDYSSDAIFRAGPGGDIEYANPAASDLTGYSKEDLLQMRPSDLSVGPEDRDWFPIEHQRKSQYSFERIGEIRTKSGERLPVEILSVFLPSDAESTAWFFVRDITERRELEDQLMRAQRLEAVGQLAGGIAHDFNNLLTVITGNAQVLLEEAEEAGKSEWQSCAQDLLDASRRAADLTEQLLTFSKRQQASPEPISVHALVEGLDSMLDRVMGEDIQNDLNLQAEEDVVHIDPNALEQAILNISLNARDAMPKGGIFTIATRTITQEKQQDRFSRFQLSPGSHLEISFRDTGVGMDEETRSRVFEPFFTTKGPVEGTGLGLSMVFGSIKQAGGEIHIESEPGEGTEVFLFLPLSPEQSAIAQEPAQKRKEIVGGNERILLVEDNREVLKWLGRFLRSLGYTVLEASSPSDALTKLEQTQAAAPNLLITDIVMPEMNGVELAEKITAASPNIPVLYISGYADRDIIGKTAHLPSKDLVQKPFTRATLATRIRRLLDRA